MSAVLSADNDLIYICSSQSSFAALQSYGILIENYAEGLCYTKGISPALQIILAHIVAISQCLPKLLSCSIIILPLPAVILLNVILLFVCVDVFDVIIAELMTCELMANSK